MRTSTEDTERMSCVFMVNNSVLYYVITKRFHTGIQRTQVQVLAGSLLFCFFLSLHSVHVLQI